MKFSVITPNYNGERFLEKTIVSVLNQSKEIDLEYIIIDADSSDSSHEIINKYRGNIQKCVIEKDEGPAQAINKGFQLATGDIVSWLNSDDIYYPGSLKRIQQIVLEAPDASMFFGDCSIVDADGREIRRGISFIKKAFFQLSCRFTYQCINYISQPALFFRKDCLDRAGLLREDLVAAWDYELILKMWHYGHAQFVGGEPLAAFRWYEQSISGRNYMIQFQEEYEAAKKDAGNWSPQRFIHLLVRWGIVSSYSVMAGARTLKK